MAASNGCHGLENRVVRRPGAHQNLSGGIFVRGRDAQQNMFCRDVFVFQALRFIEGALENLICSGA